MAMPLKLIGAIRGLTPRLAVIFITFVITGCRDIDILDLSALWETSSSDGRLNGYWESDSDSADFILWFTSNESQTGLRVHSKRSGGKYGNSSEFPGIEFPVASVMSEALIHDYLIVQISITNILSYLIKSGVTLQNEGNEGDGFDIEDPGLMSGSILAYTISEDSLVFFRLNPSVLGNEVYRRAPIDNSTPTKAFDFSAKYTIPSLPLDQLRLADANGFATTEAYRFRRRIE